MRRSSKPIASRVQAAIAAAVVLIAAGGFLWQNRDCGLMGWDSYPLIAASRVQTAGDLRNLFAQELMGGRYEGHFYRPLVSLSFAVDYAVWGLAPFGYQLTDVLLFAACAASLYLLMRRATGSGVAALVALAFFLLHPTHVEVVAVPARRPELLCAVFTCLSLAVLLSRRGLDAGKPAVLSGVLAMLAAASKETAFILPALGFLAVLLYSPRPTLPRRLRHAVVALIPQLVAVGALGAARLAVLGGVGGHASTQVSAAAGRFVPYLGRVFELLLFPQALMLESRVFRGMLIALAAGAVLVGVMTLLARRGAPLRQATLPLPPPYEGGGVDLGRSIVPGSVQCAALGAVWLGLLALIYAAAGTVAPWYTFLPVVALAMLVGVLAQVTVTALRSSHAGSRAVAMPTLALLLLCIGWEGRYSPLVCRYEEWARASAASRSFFEQLGGAIGRTPDGATVTAPPVPVWVEWRADRPSVLGASVLMDYSIQAWAELTFPQRHIRVCKAAQARGRTPAADEVLVLLTRGLYGFSFVDAGF